jgi:hypothetical protein
VITNTTITIIIIILSAVYHITGHEGPEGE